MAVIYVYLFYGFAFLATGLILGLQVRVPFVAVPREALKLFAIFALAHGAAEWLVLGALVQDLSAPRRFVVEFRFAASVVSALSYGVLLQFAVELWVSLDRGRSWLRWAPAVVMLAWASATALAGSASIATADAGIRYAVCATASLLSARGLWKVSSLPSATVTSRSRRLLRLAGLAFLAYAVFAGVIVAPAPFFPASHVNTDTFLAVTHIPVQVLRALCAVTLGWALSEAFVVEASRAGQEVERLREEFLSVVAHDLRVPITAIGLNAELIERDVTDGESGARIRRHLEQIRSAGDRLDRMVSDLLDASRVEARRLSLMPEPTDLRVVLLAVTERAVHLCAGHPVRAALPDTLPQVEVDVDRLEQVLTNLLSNAGKYSREGTEIVVTAMARSREVEVGVANLGEPLSREDAASIFNRFSRAPGASAKAPGLGIGLYIARGLVEAHGGRIWVDAESGQTTFRFTLPRVDR